MKYVTLRVSPRVHALTDGRFQPNVLFDDGGTGNIICGEPVATLEDADKLARSACEAVFPEAKWMGEWLST